MCEEGEYVIRAKGDRIKKEGKEQKEKKAKKARRARGETRKISRSKLSFKKP